MAEASTWRSVFGCQPPRQTVVRICRRLEAVHHGSMKKHNVRGARDFRRQARRILRWYTQPKRNSMVKRRHKSAVEVAGRQSVVNRKVRIHFRRLTRRLRVRGMMAWRRVALATLEAGVSVQSGTIPAERYWACMSSFWPPHASQVSRAWYQVLADLAFVRFNHQLFSSGALPGLAERDALVASKLDSCMVLARALHESEAAAGHLTDLFDPFRK